MPWTRSGSGGARHQRSERDRDRIAGTLLGVGAKVIIADLQPIISTTRRAVHAAHDNRLLSVKVDVTDRKAMAEAADRCGLVCDPPVYLVNG